MIVEVVAMLQIHFACQVQIAFIVITSSIARQFEGNFVSKILKMYKGKGKVMCWVCLVYFFHNFIFVKMIPLLLMIKLK